MADPAEPTGSGERWPDIMGRVDGVEHCLPVRVYYEDTDFSGAVYHANYLRFCERGRSDFLRLVGVHHTELQAGAWDGHSYGFVARRITMDFLKPATIDDLLEVRTAFTAVAGARFQLRQSVSRDNDVLFQADVTVAMVGPSGRPVRIPVAMVELVQPYLDNAVNVS